MSEFTCLSARLGEKLQADLAEVFRIGWAWSQEEVIGFWW